MHMPTNKAEAVCKQKQANKLPAVSLWLFFLEFPVIILPDSLVLQPESTCIAAGWPEASPTHLVWRARRRTWRCHWLQSPSHLGLGSLHHMILRVQPIVRPQSLISGTFCLLFTVFSSSSENIWILLPFRSNLALQAVTFVRLSMASIQSDCFACSLHSQRLGVVMQSRSDGIF